MKNRMESMTQFQAIPFKATGLLRNDSILKPLVCRGMTFEMGQLREQDSWWEGGADHLGTGLPTSKQQLEIS